MPSTIDPSSLIARIEAAFEGVTLGGGISLNECEYHDSGGSAERFLELARQDEREDWRRVVNDRLTWFRVTFSFTDLEGYRFYLPAYMTWTLGNYQTSDSPISDFTIYALDPSFYQFEQTPFVEFFSDERLDVILDFLQFCIENGDYLDGTVADENRSKILALMGTNP